MDAENSQGKGKQKNCAAPFEVIQCRVWPFSNAVLKAALAPQPGTTNHVALILPFSTAS
jgi:hypothetical protein